MIIEIILQLASLHRALRCDKPPVQKCIEVCATSYEKCMSKECDVKQKSENMCKKEYKQCQRKCIKLRNKNKTTEVL